MERAHAGSPGAAACTSRGSSTCSNRYGSCVDELLELIEADPSLAEPIPSAADYLKAEAVYAATHEGALHIEDVLRRRLRASIEEWDQGAAAAPEVAALMAPVLGWDAETAKRETEHYCARSRPSATPAGRPDDAAADAARRARLRRCSRAARPPETPPGDMDGASRRRG